MTKRKKKTDWPALAFRAVIVSGGEETSNDVASLKNPSNFCAPTSTVARAEEKKVCPSLAALNFLEISYPLLIVASFLTPMLRRLFLIINQKDV